MGWARIETNGALSVGLLVSGVAAYPIGKWIDSGHGRVVMASGSVLASAMLALWAFSTTVSMLFVVWVGLGVAMAATLYDPVFAIVTRDHPTSYRTHITLITLVGGFASTLFIPFTGGLVGWLGWRETLLVLSAFNLALCLPIHLKAIARTSHHRVDTNSILERRYADKASAQRALRTPAFWALALCFTAYYATFAALTFHLVPLLAERHVSTATTLFTMALIGPAQVGARLVWFATGRQARVSQIGVVVTLSLCASLLVLLAAGNSVRLLVVFATLYGGANGMMTILRGIVVQELLWVEGYGAVSGMLSLPSNIAKGIAPIGAASLWAIGGSYEAFEWIAFALSVVAAAAYAVAVTSARESTAPSSAVAE